MDPPDLLSCSPEELTTWLCEKRFLASVEPTETFLKKAVEALQQKRAEANATDLGEILLTTTVSMVNPRAKVSLEFCKEGLAFKAKESFVLEPDNVEQVVLFADPQSKKLEHSLVLILLKKPILFKNKPLSQLCWKWPKDPPPSGKPAPEEPEEQEQKDDGKDEEKEKGGSDEEEEEEEEKENEWTPLLVSSLKLLDDKIVRVIPTNTTDYHFESFQEKDTSSTTGGLPYVTATQGVQSGVVFPLEEGMLFYKPPLWLPRNDITSLECAAGGGGRYLSLLIHCQDPDDKKSTVELTSIHRQEYPVLQEYIRVLGTGGGSDEEDDSDEEEKQEANSSGRPSRTASRQARKALKQHKRAPPSAEEDDEEEEDDIDYQEAEKDESGSDSDDEDEDDDDEEEHDETESEDEEDDPPKKKSRKS
jgi:hypothetical protein